MTFYVNKGSNHNLIITFDYSPERVNKIKQVTNRWNPVEKYWEIADTEHIRRFLNVFQDEEVIFDPRIGFIMTESNRECIKETKWLKELIEQTDCALKLKGYSSLTIAAYIGHTQRFFVLIRKYYLRSLELHKINDHLSSNASPRYIA